MSMSQHLTMQRRRFLLSGASSGVFLCLFATAIGTPVSRASTSISLVLLASSGIIKMSLKIMGKKINKHRKIA